MQARYYDPVIGRFYSNDPVGTVGHLAGGNVQGFNRYMLMQTIIHTNTQIQMAKIQFALHLGLRWHLPEWLR
ncbi:hypothetical protein RS130_15620 [Paraglaciecola aquimarina]|uniref:Uncharacterized protein n=1 Tax=Paraglaciecola aquimarina TaxID=1235557 RepID=A0ABU3SYP8_9ALTE|nr:hypothetical protein [Paraglaciecola aquimarina]MDU0355140.1 hypothetical protein [Paraglaciecola aquimarina]